MCEDRWSDDCDSEAEIATEMLGSVTMTCGTDDVTGIALASGRASGKNSVAVTFNWKATSLEQMAIGKGVFGRNNNTSK